MSCSVCSKHLKYWSWLDIMFSIFWLPNFANHLLVTPNFEPQARIQKELDLNTKSALSVLKYHLQVKTSAAVLPNIMKPQSAAAGELQYGCQREGDINWKHRKRNLSRAALCIRAVNVHRLPVFIKLAELTSESGSRCACLLPCHYATCILKYYKRLNQLF